MNIQELVQKIKQKRSAVVVGLDPRYKRIPEEYKEGVSISKAIFNFNKDVIDGVCESVPAVKLQVAFYEKYGIEGLQAYIESKKYAKSKGLFVIGDVKRGDIGSTSKAYSNAHLEPNKDFEVDNITVNPYLGVDCLNEFVEDIKKHDKSIFVLVKTSNPSSAQIQDIEKDGKTIYDRVAVMVEEINKQFDGEFGPIGAVVGATYPEELLKLRKLMPKAYFLVPGYGAQGGGASDVLDAFNKDGLGAIINSSRGVIFNYEKTNTSVREGARLAVEEMNQAINTVLEENNKKYW